MIVASKMYDVAELESRIDLVGVAEKEGWGMWCEKDFRDEQVKRGASSWCAVRATPLFDEDGKMVTIIVKLRSFIVDEKS